MDILKKTAELSESGKPFMLATIISTTGSSPARPGFRLVVTQGGQTFGTIGGGAIEKIITDEALSILDNSGVLPGSEVKKLNLGALGMECGGQVEIFIEYFGGKKHFILFGGGHIGRALAPILELLEYSVTIFDNRPEISADADAPGRNIVIADYTDISRLKDELGLAAGCCIATHGHEFDLIVLEQVLKETLSLKYIGMIGSRKKVESILDSLKSSGISIPNSLFSPVGLKIGGNSAAEIAVSIAAEIVAVNNGADTEHMRT